jgi:hypothetical protein
MVRQGGRFVFSSITDQPAPDAFVRFREGVGQRFVVTIDTEEEFDWTKPLTARGIGWIRFHACASFSNFAKALASSRSI